MDKISFEYGRCISGFGRKYAFPASYRASAYCQEPSEIPMRISLALLFHFLLSIDYIFWYLFVSCPVIICPVFLTLPLIEEGYCY